MYVSIHVYVNVSCITTTHSSNKQIIPNQHMNVANLLFSSTLVPLPLACLQIVKHDLVLVDMTRTKSLGWITRLSLIKNLCWHIYNYTWIIPFEKSLEKVFISYFFKRFFKEGRLCKSPFKNYFFFTDNGRSHYHPWGLSKEWVGWGHVCKHLFPVTECFLQLYLWSGCFTSIMTYMSKIMYYYIIMI